MHFVYMCRNGENEELRYSIRSVLASFPDAEIWVVGGKPSWYRGNHIALKQSGNKYGNVKLNINMVLESQEIPHEFVYMNDDFFIVDKILQIPLLSGKLLEKRVRESQDCCSRFVYHKKLAKTLSKLKKMGFENPVDFELHVPMLVNKTQLQRSVKLGYLWRSFYGNLYVKNATPVNDVKVYEHVTDPEDLKNFAKKSSPFLSTNDQSFEFVRQNYLHELFPNKSKHER